MLHILTAASMLAAWCWSRISVSDTPLGLASSCTRIDKHLLKHSWDGLNTSDTGLCGNMDWYIILVSDYYMAIEVFLSV